MFRENGDISTFEFFEMFPNEDAAIEYMEELRWEYGVTCPRCDCENTTRLKEYPYHLCNGCRKKFTIRTGTVFERSHIPLHKWMYAMYLLETSRKGISSIKLAQELGITQKSSWFMLHRLRKACEVEAMPLEGEVEVDETFVGGKKGRMHYAKRKELPPGPLGGKTIVLGMRERGSGTVIAYPIGSRDIGTLTGEIVAHVEEDSTVYTDEHGGYNVIGEYYDHQTVVHTQGNYQDGNAHTNGIESVWAVLKRGFKGVYHHWSKKHMTQYLNEFVFRLNEGNSSIPIIDRMEAIFRNAIGKRITYKELVSD